MSSASIPGWSRTVQAGRGKMGSPDRARFSVNALPPSGLYNRFWSRDTVVQRACSDRTKRGATYKNLQCLILLEGLPVYNLDTWRRLELVHNLQKRSFYGRGRLDDAIRPHDPHNQRQFFLLMDVARLTCPWYRKKGRVVVPGL